MLEVSQTKLATHRARLSPNRFHMFVKLHQCLRDDDTLTFQFFWNTDDGNVADDVIRLVNAAKLIWIQFVFKQV